MNKNTMTIIVVAIVVGAIGFFGGMQYQKSRISTQFAGAGFGGGQGGMRNGFPGGRTGQGRGGAVVGQITSSDDKSITVTMQDGSSKIVILSSSTSINKAAQATKSDLKTGERVAVFGTPNSDGSVTAQSIQLNPVMRMRMGGQEQRPTQTP